MKITIEGIRKLKDGTVSAQITTAKENYIPLVMLDEQASKGKDLSLDIQDSIQPSNDIGPLIVMIQDLITESYARGLEHGKAEATQGNLLIENGE